MGVRLASGGIADSEGTRVELRVEVRKDASSARRASDRECGGRGRTPVGAEDGAPRSPAPRASVNSAAFRRLSAAPFLGAASRSPSAHLPESLSPTRAPQPCDLRRQADFPLLIRPDFLERRIWTAYQIGGRKGCSQECGAGRRVAIPRGFRSAKTSSPTKRVL